MAAQTFKNWYAILEVAPDATHEEVKRAYRRRAFVCHPDRGGSAYRMKAVNEAWAVLGDAEARRQYDAERRQEHALEQQEGDRKSARPVQVRAAGTNTEAAPETIVSDLGRIGMVLAFGVGRAIRSTIRFVRRLLKF